MSVFFFFCFFLFFFQTLEANLYFSNMEKLGIVGWVEGKAHNAAKTPWS